MLRCWGVEVLRISISSYLSTARILSLLIDPSISVLVVYLKTENPAQIYSYEWVSDFKKVVNLVHYRSRRLLDDILKHTIAWMGVSTKSTTQHSLAGSQWVWLSSGSFCFFSQSPYEQYKKKIKEFLLLQALIANVKIPLVSIELLISASLYFLI